MLNATTVWQATALLAAGLGLFLYGIGVLADALRQTADTALRGMLARGTKSPLRSLGLGTAVTAVLQSSSASTVLMVGLCNAGLLSLRQSVGMVIGSSIGGTITTQLLTVNLLAELAPWAVCAGALLTLFARRRMLRISGTALLGFGLIFVGFDLMKHGVEPLEPSFKHWFTTLAQPGTRYLLASLGIGVVATMVTQSSAVTTGMVIALAGQGVISDMPSALALMTGCNIGTTITTVLASAGGSNAAKQLAATHVIYRSLAGILSLLAIPLYAGFFAGGEPMARDLANFHTLHNTVNAFIFLPFSGILAWLAVRLAPGSEDASPAPLYLDFSRGVAPAERSRQAHMEILRLVEITRSMTADALAGMLSRQERAFESVLAREQQVDGLHDTITQFLLVPEDGPRPDTALAPARLLQLAHNIERIGDHAENLVELARFYQPPKQSMHADLLADVTEAGRLLDELFETGTPALSVPDAGVLGQIAQKKAAFDDFVAARTAHAHGMAGRGQCRPIDAALFEDFLANLLSSATHLQRAARAVIANSARPGTEAKA